MGSSLGERAFGCGRWTSALTEASQSDVRSLIRAPLGLFPQGGCLSRSGVHRRRRLSRSMQ